MSVCCLVSEQWLFRAFFHLKQLFTAAANKADENKLTVNQNSKVASQTAKQQAEKY